MSSLRVLDQDGGVLLELTGDALGAVTKSNLGQPAVYPAAQVSVEAEVDVKVPVGDPSATGLSHEIAWTLPADASVLTVLSTDSGTTSGLPLTVSDVAPVTVAAPLRGAGWTVLQGCCLPNGHRSLRYALDGSHKIEAEMFALDWAADGTVVAVRDGMPNEIPDKPLQHVKTGQDYVGNTVIVKIAPDR